MSGDDPLGAELENALAALAIEQPQLARAITPIIRQSLVGGRVAKVLGGDPELGAAGYVRRVAEHYELEHERVHALLAKDEESWKILVRVMQGWAFWILLGRRFGPGRREWAKHWAGPCAQDAAVILLTKPFPFDVAFDPWAHEVVRNVCKRRLKDEFGSEDGKKRPAPLSLDETEDWEEHLRDPRQEQAFVGDDELEEMLILVGRMASELRREFVILYYLEGRGFDEIALLMGRERNTLYKLHFDAKEELRKLLGGR